MTVGTLWITGDRCGVCGAVLAVQTDRIEGQAVAWVTWECLACGWYQAFTFDAAGGDL
jgi:RNase P subunit RPR2